MTRFTKLKGSGMYAAFAALMVLSACATEAVGPAPVIPAEPGHAFLKIVGDKNVFLGTGESREITVKYVNERDEGLAGSVSFRLDGDAKGSSISSNSEVTGPGGTVSISIAGGNEAAFRIVAEAQYATPVDWAVAVRTGGDNPPLPFNIVGTYRVESSFDIATGLPGTAGQVINTFIDLTNDPNDPTKFLLDLAANEDEGVKNAMKLFRPALDVALNSLLKQITTTSINGTQVSIVGKFQELGNGFGDVAKKFGLKSQIQIYKDPMDGSKYLAKHTIDGVFFKINSKRTDKTLAQLNMDNIVVDKIPVTLTGESQIAFAEHRLGLSYGRLVMIAVDNILIPLITQNRAMNLTELLADLIDCEDVASSIADEIGGSPDLWGSVCDTALALAGNVLEGKLAELGGTGSEFRIAGTTRPADTDSDNKVDQLVGGLWEGKLMFGATESAALAKPNQTFTGMRMGN